jgi:ribosome biogenesis protein UTP30
VRVKVPHALFFPDILDHNICLFCKTDEKEAVVDAIKKNHIPAVDKVLSVTDVVKVAKQYKDKKQLRAEHSHFLCDARIVRQLYNALGTTFNHISSMPIAIDMEDQSKLSNSIKKAVDSTYMHIRGKNITFRIAFSHMEVQEIIENILEGLQFGVEKIPGGWKNIHSIHLKSAESAAIPIYGKATNEAMKVLQETAQALRSMTAEEQSSQQAGQSTVPETARKEKRKLISKEEKKVTKKSKV